MSVPFPEAGLPFTGPPVVDAGGSFEGLLAFRGHARVDGCIEGGIFARGSVEIGPGAFVRGPVEVDEAVVEGVVEGEIRARERIELRSGARVRGDLPAPRLALADGCLLLGRLRTGSPG